MHNGKVQEDVKVFGTLLTHPVTWKSLFVFNIWFFSNNELHPNRGTDKVETYKFWLYIKTVTNPVWSFGITFGITRLSSSLHLPFGQKPINLFYRLSYNIFFFPSLVENSSFMEQFVGRYIVCPVYWITICNRSYRNYA